MYNSFQAALVVEALAPKPGLKPMQEARALKALSDAWTKVAGNTGIREMYFVCADDRLGNFVCRHGWERLNYPVYRVKV